MGIEEFGIWAMFDVAVSLYVGGGREVVCFVFYAILPRPNLNQSSHTTHLFVSTSHAILAALAASLRWEAPGASAPVRRARAEGAFISN